MATIRGYMLPIAFRQTAATAADSTLWAMRNLGVNRAVYIRRLVLNVTFDGVAAASTSQYEVRRFRTATPTGGTALTVVKKNTNDAASAITDARFVDTGLTVVGVAYDAPSVTVGAPRAAAAIVQGMYEWPGMSSGQGSGAFVLAENDGLCIRNGLVTVIGDAVTGWIEWDEVGGRY